MRKREKVFLICAAAIIAVLFVIASIYNIGVLHGGSRAISTFCAGETQ